MQSHPLRMFTVVCTVMGIVWMFCVLSSQLNRVSLEVIFPEYMQTQFVYVLFWPSYSDTLCIWLLYQLYVLVLILSPIYHHHWLLLWWIIIAIATETWNVGLTQSMLPHCSLKHSGLTSTGAIALARALQHNKSLEELKWVLNNTWGLYKFNGSLRHMIISTIPTHSYSIDS